MLDRCSLGDLLTFASQLIVATASTLGASLDLNPTTCDEAFVFETAKDRIDRARRKPSGLAEFESVGLVAGSIEKGLEDKFGGMAWLAFHV